MALEMAMENGLPNLLDRCAAGDRVALEALYRRYADLVWRQGWYRTRSREAAAEIVQETFLRVVRSISSFERRSSFSTWLFAVARAVAIDHCRRARRDAAERSLRFLDVQAATERVVDRDVQAAVREAVAGLPGAQRDAVVLCELSGMCIREASAILGWSESRVKVTLFRARRRLAGTLKRLGLDARHG